MKAYNIVVEPYEYEMEEPKKNEFGDLIKGKTKTIYFTYELPRILCNPNLGVKENAKGDLIPVKDFDFMDMGAIAHKIERCTNPYLTVNTNEWELLKKRVKQIANFCDYRYFEMFSRIINAKETILEEVKKD